MNTTYTRGTKTHQTTTKALQPGEVVLTEDLASGRVGIARAKTGSVLRTVASSEYVEPRRELGERNRRIQVTFTDGTLSATYGSATTWAVAEIEAPEADEPEIVKASITDAMVAEQGTPAEAPATEDWGIPPVPAMVPPTEEELAEARRRRESAEWAQVQERLAAERATDPELAEAAEQVAAAVAAKPAPAKKARKAASKPAAKPAAERHAFACQHCNLPTKGGNYLPGHDAKHVSALVAEVRTGRDAREALAELAGSPRLTTKLLQALAKLGLHPGAAA